VHPSKEVKGVVDDEENTRGLSSSAPVLMEIKFPVAASTSTMVLPSSDDTVSGASAAAMARAVAARRSFI